MSALVVTVWIVLPIAAIGYLAIILWDLFNKTKRAAVPALELAEKLSDFSKATTIQPSIEKSDGNLFDDPGALEAERRVYLRKRLAKQQATQRRLITRLTKNQESEF